MSKDYKPTELNYTSYLSSILECEEKQDSSISHAWTFTFKNDAIKVCNYLKNSGYKAQWSEWSLIGSIIYYVGVPFDTLKKTLLIIIILLPLLSQSQYKYEQPRLKEYAPSAALVFAGGIFKELRDASMFYRIKDGGFFDGRESWKRKYRNGDYKAGEAFPLSTSVLVGFTDNVHFSQMMYGQCESWAICLTPYDANKKFTHLVLKVLAKTAIEGTSRAIVYQWFKNGNR